MNRPTEDVRSALRQTTQRDPLGKAALFSATDAARPPFGTIVVECSACSRETPVGLRDLPRLLFPLPVTLPRKFHTLATCPACSRRTWVRARLSL